MAPEDSTSLRVASFSCYLDTAKENLVQRISDKDSITSLRVDSLSYNLNAAGENFVFKVPRPVLDPAPAFSFRQETPCPINLERSKCGDAEISVFGAEKYFNVKLDNRVRAETSVGSINPSVRSEESSWNSQNGLLQDRRRTGSQAKQKKSFGGRFFAGIGCPGICFNKKPVQINEIVVPGRICESKATPEGSEKINHFAFQIPSSGSENSRVLGEMKEEKSDQPRISLEVFGSSSYSMKGDMAKKLERKLSMLTWDAVPISSKNLAIPTPGNTSICDDMASDASSDLFEIENISSGSVYSKLKVESDHMLGCPSPSPTTQYAPSEASIEWSVVTASAADYSSVISDYYDEKIVSAAGAGDIIPSNRTFSFSKTRASAGYWDART